MISCIELDVPANTPFTENIMIKLHHSLKTWKGGGGGGADKQNKRQLINYTCVRKFVN